MGGLVCGEVKCVGGKSNNRVIEENYLVFEVFGF